MADTTADRAIAIARARGPRLGVTTLVLIDGPAGAGKTTLAGEIAVALGGRASAGAGTFDPSRPVPDGAVVQTLHGDDMYEGWGGLSTLDDVLVDQVLAPLSAGRTGSFRMWDWTASSRSHEIAVPPRPYLVIEGVGVASHAARRHASCVVLVDAPRELRLERGIARDGEAMRGEWERWQEAEGAHLDASGVRDAADLVLDTSA
ncbi:hypothetical protein QQX13_13325 [Demequina sp. SYSU T00068]|uniref:uridine kinase family protein n=1 Tax=Demequina lignilytica TaxID=3051663 RepID=UPI00262489C8|nr:hypothetical protein [Demequina sp. SYSU T00068]MDN4491816.1 hypothetical protein [Demequina sp. SYSU T00068]